MSVTVKVSGGIQIEAALRELGKRSTMLPPVKRALKAAAEPIRAKWVALAPDDPATSGNLKIAIKDAPLPSSDKDQVWHGIGIDQSVDPPTEKPRKRGEGSYRDPGVAGNAVIQEFGSAKMPASPSARPAWDAEGPATAGRIAAALGPEIEKTAARLARRAGKAR